VRVSCIVHSHPCAMKLHMDGAPLFFGWVSISFVQSKVDDVRIDAGC
jgi:hypothetical protein